MDLNNPLINEAVKKGVDNIKTVGGYLGKAEDWLDDKLGVNDLTPEIKKAVDMAIDYGPMGIGTIFKGFHGTNVKIAQFKKEMLGSSTGAKSASKGFWFTDNPDVASSYATYAAEFAPIQKILDEADVASNMAMKTNLEKDWNIYDKLVEKAELLEKEITENRMRGQNIIPANLDIKKPKTINALGKTYNEMEGKINQYIDIAKARGHDGLVIKNLDDSATFANRPSTHYIVFEPKQITSSITKKNMAEDFLEQ